MFLGIDGGGSSTRALWLDEQGTVVMRARGGPGNALVAGFDQARDTIRDLLTRHAGPVRSAVVGLAGVDRPWLYEAWRTFLDRVIPGPYWLIADYRIAWAALNSGDPGIVAVLGTGSVCYGERQSDHVKIGGYGFKLGDAGSGIQLGLLAVRSALENYDRIGPHTVLAELVTDYFQASDREGILTAFYRPDFELRKVSSLAPQVLHWASKGDSVASHLVADQGQKVVSQLLAIRTQLGDPIVGVAGLVGGLAARWHPFLETIWKEKTGSDLRLAATDPEDAAAHLARRWWSETGKRFD